MMIFLNKTVLITGASSGIGKSCAYKFAEQKANLILVARRKERLLELQSDLEKKFNVKILILELDVRDKTKVDEILANIPESFSTIDILVNNAGLARGKDKIHEANWDDWEEMIDTNLKGLLAFTRAIVPGMVKRSSGHVINIGSVAGHEPYPGGSVYNATKFGVKAFTYAMRMDLNGSGIRVSLIDPGSVETDFSIVRFHGNIEQAKKVYENFTPLTAEDIAETILWVASRPKHVNIQDIIIMSTDQASATINFKRS